MSAGHRSKTTLTSSELDDLLDEVLVDPRVKKMLARPFKLITDKDVPLLGSSNAARTHVYLDVHLRHRDWPYGTIPVGDRRLNVVPGLIRHERLEPILEDVFGWKYSPPSHEIAQHWEERDYIDKDFDPREVEKAFKPYIRNDQGEPLPKVPLDMDLRPETGETELLTRIRSAQQAQKVSQMSVGYVTASKYPDRRCELCSMFLPEKFGGPACTLVKSDINPKGWCRRFSRGSMVISKS